MVKHQDELIKLIAQKLERSKRVKKNEHILLESGVAPAFNPEATLKEEKKPVLQLKTPSFSVSKLPSFEIGVAPALNKAGSFFEFNRSFSESLSKQDEDRENRSLKVHGSLLA